MMQQANNMTKSTKTIKRTPVRAETCSVMFVASRAKRVKNACPSVTKQHSLRSRNRQESYRCQSCKSCQLCELKLSCHKRLVPATLRNVVFSDSGSSKIHEQSSILRQFLVFNFSLLDFNF